MKRLLAAFALIFAALCTQPLAALAQLPPGTELGPKVGATLPAISAVATTGETRTLAQLHGQKGVTLVFYRSADWCPFCKLQLKNLNTVAKDMETAGWPLVAVSYDPAETLSRFSTAEKLAFPLMTDPGSKAIDALGIRNTAMDGKPRFEGIPHPLILFVARDGTVKAKLYEEAYQKRPPADLVLSTARGLN